MDTTASTPETETQHDTTAGRRRLSKKVRALLAGGLVLGLGATVTLAAWNDSEFATGTFTAGKFNLEGSTDNSTWDSHDASTPAGLAFKLAPENLSPNTTVYAPFAVRLDSTTTSDATVSIKVSGTVLDVSNLTYSLIKTSSFGCEAATTGTSLVTAGTAVSTVAGPAAFDLSIGTPAGPGGVPAATAGAPTFLCFKVTAGSGLVQGQRGAVVWEFAASSKS